MKAILKINDKEIEVEVSEKQIEDLTEKKNPFNRVCYGKDYYYIEANGTIQSLKDFRSAWNLDMEHTANYCTDIDLIQQQAYRETLNRLLWRWQYEHDEPCDWGDFDKAKYCIRYNFEDRKFILGYNEFCKSQGRVYFTTAKKAEQAIKDVVKPFMKEHPDFVW